MNHIPILGRGPNTRAIKILENVLEAMKKGELVNVAIVAEQKLDGQVIMSFDVEPGNGEAVKMAGALGLLASTLFNKLQGK